MASSTWSGTRVAVRCPRLKARRDDSVAALGSGALPADSLPAVGFLNTAARIYTIARHSGITLGPLPGRLAAQEIITGAPDLALASFRPDSGQQRPRKLCSAGIHPSVTTTTRTAG